MRMFLSLLLDPRGREDFFSINFSEILCAFDMTPFILVGIPAVQDQEATDLIFVMSVKEVDEGLG
jgi:hypothetical protein